MHCLDCCRFVGLENGEPECSGDIEANLSGGSINLSVSAEVPRNCAECGTELKRGSYDLELDIETDEIVEAAPEAIREEVRKMLEVDEGDVGGLTVDVSEDGLEAEEGGGGRYAKNMITLNVNATVTIRRADGAKFGNGEAAFEFPAVLTGELAAGEFEEQV